MVALAPMTASCSTIVGVSSIAIGRQDHCVRAHANACPEPRCWGDERAGVDANRVVIAASRSRGSTLVTEPLRGKPQGRESPCPDGSPPSRSCAPRHGSSACVVMQATRTDRVASIRVVSTSKRRCQPDRAGPTATNGIRPTPMSSGQTWFLPKGHREGSAIFTVKNPPGGAPSPGSGTTTKSARPLTDSSAYVAKYRSAIAYPKKGSA